VHTPQPIALLPFCLLALVAGLPAQSGQQPSPPAQPPVSMMEASPILRVLDVDHDHVITAAELANAPAMLRTLDKNGDGKLTRDEVGAPPPQRGRGREGEGDEPPQTPAPGPTADELFAVLMSYDANHDGRLQKSEVPQRLAGLFERGDANGDGLLDAAELKKVAADQAAAPVAPPPAGRGRGRGGFGRFDPAAAALDKDGNGEISADEIAGATAALKILDKNNDGRITEDELMPSGEGREGRGALR
jgi:Ca2+-binding EF-hand superfamily protein